MSTQQTRQPAGAVKAGGEGAGGEFAKTVRTQASIPEETMSDNKRSAIFSSHTFDTPEEHIHFYMHEGHVPEQVISNVRYAYNRRRKQDVDWHDERQAIEFERALLAGEEWARETKRRYDSIDPHDYEAQHQYKNEYTRMVRKQEEDRFPMKISPVEAEAFTRAVNCMGHIRDNFSEEEIDQVRNYVVDSIPEKLTVKQLMVRYRDATYRSEWFYEAITLNDLAAQKSTEDLAQLIREKM